MRQLMCTLLMCGLMVSCAVSGDRHAQTISQSVENIPVRKVPPPAHQQPTDKLMFNILLGEIAGQRGDFKVSIKHYLEAAQASRDPRVAQRAMQIATYAHRPMASPIRWRSARSRWASGDGSRSSSSIGCQPQRPRTPRQRM